MDTPELVKLSFNPARVKRGCIMCALGLNKLCAVVPVP